MNLLHFSYLEIVDAERGAVLGQRLQVRLAGERLAATVHLIRALGGGWSTGTEANLGVPAGRL